MSDQTVAASSPAEVDPFNGIDDPSGDKFRHWRATGELPEEVSKPAEPAEAAPADAPEETAESETEQVESAPESEPEETQEQHKGSGAEKRIKQLLAKTKELERKLAEKQDVKPEPSPAQQQQQSRQQPQTYREWRPSFNAAQWNQQYSAANPNATFEEIEDARSDYLADAREHFRAIEQQKQAQQRELADKISEGEAIYGKDFGKIADDVAGVIGSDPTIPEIVKARLVKSDLYPHLAFTIGDDPKALDEFIRDSRTDAFKALDSITLMERAIRDHLAADKPERDASGKFTKAEEKAPEKRQTSAPKPPSPVNSGGNSRAFDVNDESLSNNEWFRQRNIQVANRK